MKFEPLIGLARQAKLRRMKMECDPQWVLDLAAERDQLSAEVDRRARNEIRLGDLYSTTEKHLIASGIENDRLREEVEALRKDAERLDWLIEQGNVGCLVQEGTHGFWMAWLEEHDSGRHKYQDGHYATGRKAIDAAMAAKEGE